MTWATQCVGMENKMCGKLGDNEIESMQSMMSIAVYSIVADAFNVDIESISPDSDLQNDLGMTEAIKKNIEQGVSNTFDNLQLDFSRIKTIRDLVAQVVQLQMADLLNNNQE